MSDNPLQQDQISYKKDIGNENIPPDLQIPYFQQQDQLNTQVSSKDDLQIQEYKRENQMQKTLHDSLGAVGLQERSNKNDFQFTDTTNMRKASLVDCEISCEEVHDDEEDIRRKINQKLIKNKNQFMGFADKNRHKTQIVEETKIFEKKPPQTVIQFIDKRSRSETPNKMSATEVLFRAHQKLQQRQKESPQKMLEKQQLRQKKAEELRAQIENSKKKWYEKIRVRQQIAKERWQELMAERKAKLQDKLELAVERRETEIQSLKKKAEQELRKIDETNYIVKMTMNNMKLDLNMKMNETLERRNHIIEENKKKLNDRHLKEEAAEKRRLEQKKEFENKYLTNQQKRKQANQRRIQTLEEKKRAAQEYQKRLKVLQRKNDLGDRISDVMSFVSNSENIWEYLGTEREWQELGITNQQEIYELLLKDSFEIEKMKLKKDAELINMMLIIDDNSDRVYARKEYLPLLNKKKAKSCSSSSQEDDQDIDENEIFHSPEKKYLSPSKQRSAPIDHEVVKIIQEQITTQDIMSDGSDKESVAEETPRVHEVDIILMEGENQKVHQQEIELHNQNLLTDEMQNYILYSSRIKMSMKRNVLKKNLSEDLTWGEFLKNENFQYSNSFILTDFKNRRSLHSTPERKSEVPSESGKEIISDEPTATRNSNSSSIISSSNSKKLEKSSTQNLMNQNNSSSSNISEKSRISSVVYPSKKKKNPKNQNTQLSQQTNQQQTDNKGISSSHSSKMKNSICGSNQSSTQSLLIQNMIIQAQETPRDHNLNRKSVHLEQDSARKRQNARMHSSSVQESSSTTQSLGQLINSNNNINNNQTMDTDEKFFDTQSNTSLSHTGSQMNQLITNSKPILPIAKMMPKKLTANALKLLFPLPQQKLLFKRPGKEGQFGKCKLNVKLEDLFNKPPQIVSTQGTFQAQVSFGNDNNQVQTDIKQAHQIPILSPQSNQTQLQNKVEPSENTETMQKKSSLNNTPNFTKRRDSTETNNSQNQNNQGSNINADHQKEQTQGTPTQQSKLLQMHQKFWEKYHPSNQSNDQNTTIVNIKSKNAAPGNNNSIPSENSPSPKKDTKAAKQAALDEANNTLNSSQLNNSQMDNSLIQNSNSSNLQMNELGYKELIVKYLLTDNIHCLKTEDTQKTIFLEGDEANKLIDFMESNEINIRFCRLCDLIIPDHLTNESHIQTKAHKKTRDDLGIKDIEDLQLSIITIQSVPGDIEKELLKEKEKALKRKVKRLKAQMNAQAISHENASYCPGKEVTSSNKKRLQILCIDLERQVIPIIKDYDALENTLKEIIKILDMRKQMDLHLMRKLKYIPILIEICKRISVCHKNEFKNLGKALDYVIKIINTFCGLRENRNYMLQTNRMQALIELLNWCLNRPTSLVYGINFMPSLFHILTLHVKHRAPYECQQMKELYIEYLISSQITMKIKSKFSIINGPFDYNDMIGAIPLFLLKSATFLESLTNLISVDARSRPAYEKSIKIGEHVLFVVQNTELFGIISMITTILLTMNQPFKPSSSIQAAQAPQKLLPQTILSLSITSIKIINNVYRMDYRFAQHIMSEFEIQEQLYHLFNYILFYCVETIDKQEDSKELLHETLLFIGYFCLNNEKNQALLCKGENTLLQKLCNLPMPYFMDKKLKEILFPTLITASYKNERSLAIMDQELSVDMIVDFIQQNIKEELPKIIEEEYDQQSMSSVGQNAVERKSHRSPSLSSTTSSQCSLQIDMINGNSPYLPLYMRFPKKAWKDAITFYSKVIY